jgi:hypothetical protein
MSNFKIGDEIFHKSNASIKWIIERISDNEVYCSTVIKDTLEQKKEAFAITSIEKCAEPNFSVGKRTRSNFWY